MVSLDSGKELWVNFKYERLPNLCFWCGCLMHDDQECHLWVESEGNLLAESKQFSPWLKAAPFMPSQKYVVKVPSFFARKKDEAAKEKLGMVKNKPRVVVRSSKEAMERSKPKKESIEVFNVGSMNPVFQEVQKRDSKLALETKAIKQAGLGEEKQL